MKTNNLYPVFLKLDSVQTLIVGGGNIGFEKVQFILKQSPEAKIKIVSPKFHPQIIRIAIENKNVQIAERKFMNEDLDNVQLLILATNMPKVNESIAIKAKEKSILTNVVDEPTVCDFYTAAALHKGAIKIAVSSNGASPTLAKRIRDLLDEVIPEEIQETAINLRQIRNRLTGNLEQKTKILNRITEVLSNNDEHTQQLKDKSVVYNPILN